MIAQLFAMLGFHFPHACCKRKYRTIQDGDILSCACAIDLAAGILIPVPDTNEAGHIYVVQCSSYNSCTSEKYHMLLS